MDLRLDSSHLQRLLDVLTDRGYRVIGPMVRDGAIIYDDIASVDELPIGWTDHQDSGTYRLQPSGEPTFFAYTSAAQSWKRFLYPPEATLWRASRLNGHFEINAASPDPEQFAFIGVRACELAAIAVQDRVFLDGQFVDPVYQARRQNALIVAINCTRAGGTCFCASMETGPGVTTGYDLALTELVTEDRHDFLVQVGSERGAEIMAELDCPAASEADIALAQSFIDAAAVNMGRTLDTEDLKERLQARVESDVWNTIVERCMACANCTMVCPTCFCSTVEDVTDLTGTTAERVRKWDSCFTMDFSYIHGGSVRNSAKARYRQWLMHKLANWEDQFGTSGCVGCGRCITWCPAAIDITQEAKKLTQ